jgi:hypothetical protein
MFNRRGVFKISGFFRDVDEVFAVLGSHAAYVGCLPTFRDSVTTQKTLDMRLDYINYEICGTAVIRVGNDKGVL